MLKTLLPVRGRVGHPAHHRTGKAGIIVTGSLRFCALHLTLRTGFAVLALSSSVAAQTDCYDASLELSIRSSLNPADNGTRISLPQPTRWLVNIGNGQNLRRDSCTDEPVAANQAIHIDGHSLLPDEVRNVLETEGVKLTLIALSALSQDGIEPYLRSHDWWLSNVFAQAPETDTGHLRLASEKNDAVGGSWLLAKRHLDETGQRIKLGCALDCNLTYRLTDAMTLRYHLVVNDETKTPDWIAIDKAVRGHILGWFTKPQ
ncbi:MAG: hypothetical protein AAFW87_05410 [Pseudomonadota bacterium]